MTNRKLEMMIDIKMKNIRLAYGIALGYMGRLSRHLLLMVISI